MVLTNFPGGVSSFGVPQIGNGDIPSSSGTYFYVSSVIGADGYDGSFETPFATIDYAIGKCTANKGDVIVVLPKHAETISSIGGITADVAGITIVGLGFGSERPAITFDTATTTSFLISAAGVTVKNIVGVSGIDSLANPFNITGSDCTLDVEWQDVSGTYEAVRAIKATTVNNLKVKLRFRGGTVVTSAINAIRLTDVHGCRIEIDHYGLAATAVVQMVTTASTDVEIVGSMYVVGTADGSVNVVDTTGTSTWSIDVWDASAGGWWQGSHTNAPAFWTTTAVAAALYGGAGITTWPVPAAPYGNGVSMAEVLAYVQDGVRQGTGTVLPNNTSIYDILAGTGGIPTWPAAAAPANTVSLAAALSYLINNVINGTGTALTTNYSLFDLLAGTKGVATWPASAKHGNGASMAAVLGGVQDDYISLVTGSAVGLTQATHTLFTVAGGLIYVDELYGICTAANNANAATLKYTLTATAGGAVDISAASASTANAAIGTMLSITGTIGAQTVLTAPPIALAAQATRDVLAPGTIDAIVETAAISGTWYFGIRYRLLSPNATVTAAF